MKLNLAFRGGASKLPAYLRFLKELDAKGGYTGGRLSGSSAGGITAAAIACGFTAQTYRDALVKMPGHRVMRWENTMEKSKNPFVKAWYGLGVLIAGTATMTEQLTQFFFKYFSWSMVPKGVDLYVGFTLQSELAGAFGLHSGFTFFDVYKIATEKKKGQSANFAKEIFMYYGAKDGVYVFSKVTRSLQKISDDVIPLHLLALGTMWNPVFNDVDFTINASTQNPFDGGIADNFASCAQVEPYIQVACIDPKDDYNDGSLSEYYRSLAPKPTKTIYCPPVVAGKSFFDFRVSQIDKEFAVPATNALG